MMKQIAIFLVCCLFVCLSACANQPADTSSKQGISSAAVSLTDDATDIAFYDESAEQHTLEDHGMALKNADELLKEAEEFLESGGVLHNYLFVDHNTVTVTHQDLTDIDYAIALCILLWSPEQDTVTRADANAMLKSYFGIQPDHILEAPLLLNYSPTADGYTLSDPMPEGTWTVRFSSADYLGNGHLRFFGTANYTNSEGKTDSYSLKALLTRCNSASGFGFSLRAFSITSGDTQ